MRRQARISAGGALVWRSASPLQVWLWLLIFIFQNEFRISRSIQPGYLDFDNLPDTNFTCAGKVIGGYYADLETSCQMFHVCTVGQQDEPMDIKFLCLNGTVFDQETRVCERVDEVDCTKSEKFYSLNLELYGSTAPPIIQSDQEKPTESQHPIKHSHEQQTDPSTDEFTTTLQNKLQAHYPDVSDSTEDPIEIKKEDRNKSQQSSSNTPIQVSDHEELTEEYQDEDDIDYEDYSHPTTSTSTPPPTTTTVATTTTTRATTTTRTPPPTSARLPSPIPHLFSSPTPIISSLSPPVSSIPSSLSPSHVLPTLDPSILSPQDFIYRHRGPASEAISFQSFRPADGVYITHAPPQQYDHFQYESSRTAPRPAQRPTPFIQRQPSPFRPTTLDPRDQLLRPGPTSQPSERHETSVKHRQQNHPASSLPAQRPLPFNPFYYDRKRSGDTIPENESSLSARSVAPPTDTERTHPKPKSPPRVIVTASASVSDSNGKRLNYTVGNVVSAVKPIVPINYDDYKESDLIFDPFFLDVPKLQKRRKTRSNTKRRIFTVPIVATISSKPVFHKSAASSPTPETSRTTTPKETSTKLPTTTTSAWNPDDYVDDNYEPHAYIPPIPPLAMLVPHELIKYQKEKQSNKFRLLEKSHRDGYSKNSKPMLVSSSSASAALTASSQRETGGVVPPAASPAPPPPPVQYRRLPEPPLSPLTVGYVPNKIN